MEPQVESAAPVRTGEEIDAEKLAAFLHDRLPGIGGPLLIEQFPQGFSNLTYLVRAGGRELVLRRPPFGNRVKSAHDMGREFRVLSKLSEVYELAPKPLAYCETGDVIGAPFYVMERRRGVILRKKLADDVRLDPRALRRLGDSFVKNLARLHALDYEAAGLAELGKPDGYIERQVVGWTRRYNDARTGELPELEQVAHWLAAHQPAESGAALIHNDYKFDNIVLDPNDLTRITAVLDWEMSTIGDPLMDLGSTMAYWIEERDSPELKSFIAGPTNLPGNLTRCEIADRYADCSGRDTSNMLFYYCYGLFKLSGIIQQIYYRYAKGFTRDERFAKLDDVVANLGRAAAEAIARGRI
jgi:aminoglycoside phosphotransferase (APT) family kinase protein